MIYLFIAIIIIISVLVYIAIQAIDNFDSDTDIFEIEEDKDETILF